MITISQDGVDFIKSFEGLRASPYYATADEKRRGIVTIGYGSTRYADDSSVKISDHAITETEAEHLLVLKLHEFENHIRKWVLHQCTQGQWDAIVSLAYNIGTDAFIKSTLLRHLNAGKISEAADQFLRWNKQSGRVLPGLTRRREAERQMFLKENQQ